MVDKYYLKFLAHFACLHYNSLIFDYVKQVLFVFLTGFILKNPIILFAP